MEYKELDDFLYHPTIKKDLEIDWILVGGLALVFGVVAAITIFYFWL